MFKVYRWTKEISRKERWLSSGHVAYLVHSTCTWNLQSELKVPTKMHQLHYPALRTSFSGTITSCRKTAIVLKLRKVIFAKFFTSTART